MVFPVVMYGCESWTIKKAEHWKIDAFELWCWRRLLTVTWTARRYKQSILNEISPEYSLEGLMLKLKLQCFGHNMARRWLSEESAWNAGDLGSISGLRRSPGGGYGNPLQYSCLENPHGQTSLLGYSPWGHRVRHDWVTKHKTQHIWQGAIASLLKPRLASNSQAVKTSHQQSMLSLSAIQTQGKEFCQKVSISNTGYQITDIKTRTAVCIEHIY